MLQKTTIYATVKFFSGFKSQVEKGKETGHESEETKPTELARDDEDAKGRFLLDSNRL